MAVSHVETSGLKFFAASSNANISATAWAEGDMLLVIAIGKPYDSGLSLSGTGWTALSRGESGTTGAGLDQGSEVAQVWYKEATSSEGNPTLTESPPNWNNMSLHVAVWRKGASETWETPVVVYGGDEDLGADPSCTTSSIDFDDGDGVSLAIGSCSDASGPFSSLAIAQSGTTFGTVTEDEDLESTGGGDASVVTGHCLVTTAGSAGACTVSATATANPGSPRFEAVVVRLRVASGTPLVIADAAHAHAADSLTLTQHNVLAIQDAAHAHAADNQALTQHNILVVADALHGHAADNLALTQHHVLAVADALHAHAADNLTLTAHDPSGSVLAIQDAAHAHAVDNVALIQHSTLVIQDASHAHRTDAWGALVPIGDGDETVTYNADGTITLYDGGDGDFWSTADNGAMITHPVGTPGKVEATVTAHASPETNIRFLGLRSSDAANAAMFVLLTDGTNSNWSTVWRDTDGGVAGYQGEDQGPAYANPFRARVMYDGTTAYAHVSTDGGSTWTLINSRAIAVTLDTAFLGNGGGGGTHQPTTFSNEMHLTQHNILAISDALHAHTADNIVDLGGVFDEPTQQDFVRLRRRKAPIGSR